MNVNINYNVLNVNCECVLFSLSVQGLKVIL